MPMRPIDASATPRGTPGRIIAFTTPAARRAFATGADRESRLATLPRTRHAQNRCTGPGSTPAPLGPPTRSARRSPELHSADRPHVALPPRRHQPAANIVLYFRAGNALPFRPSFHRTTARRGTRRHARKRTTTRTHRPGMPGNGRSPEPGRGLGCTTITHSNDGRYDGNSTDREEGVPHPD